jgi:hypothetical protein
MSIPGKGQKLKRVEEKSYTIKIYKFPNVLNILKAPCVRKNNTRLL